MHSNGTLPLDAPLDAQCGYALRLTKKTRNLHREKTNHSKRDGILGGYSLHILQPPLGEGGVLGKLRFELRKES